MGGDEGQTNGACEEERAALVEDVAADKCGEGRCGRGRRAAQCGLWRPEQLARVDKGAQLRLEARGLGPAAVRRSHSLTEE